MSWSNLDPAIRAAMEQHLTAKQLEVMKLRATGHGVKATGRALDIAPATVRERFEGACRKLRKHAPELFPTTEVTA